MVDEKLIQAFIATEYHITTKSAGATCILRVGQSVPSDLPTPSIYFTPFNPYACQLSDRENTKRLRKLQESLSRSGVETAPGLAVDPNAKWPIEAGLWIGGASRDLGDELAATWNQLAYLVMNSSLVTLRFCHGLDEKTLESWHRRYPEFSDCIELATQNQ